ncbi:MAG: histidine kinase, partial [Actinomycetota bacterium]
MCARGLGTVVSIARRRAAGTNGHSNMAAVSRRRAIDKKPVPGEHWAWDLIGGDVISADDLYSELGIHSGDFLAIKELFYPSATAAERAGLAGALERMRASHGPFSHEVRVVRTDGKVILLKAEARIIGDGESFDASTGDTSAGDASTGNGSSSRRNLQVMQAATAMAERERMKLLGDIHDDPLQVLASADVRLEMLGRRIADPQDRELVANVQLTMRAATERLRGLVFDLSPPRLAEQGLARAL